MWVIWSPVFFIELIHGDCHKDPGKEIRIKAIGQCGLQWSQEAGLD